MKQIIAVLLFCTVGLFYSCTETTTGPQTGYGPAPPNFYMKQNFPNPFVDTTTIDYGIPNTGGSNSEVSIRVYDRFQQEVRTIVFNYSHNPGTYKTKWDGKNNQGVVVPKGVYVIEMRGYTPQATIIRVVAIKN
ncbi:MAG: FlgD immunoglobulin-like domain containing protein [Bacteroidota bacterium]